MNIKESVARDCLNSLLFDIDYRSATGTLLLIIGGYNFGLYDAEDIAHSVTNVLDPNTDASPHTETVYSQV